MILNKLNGEQLERLNNHKEQKIYEFVLSSRQNEKNDKYIYCLTLNTGEEIIARFETEIELEEEIGESKEKYCELSFVVLKVVKKEKNSKLRKNKLLYFNYKNVFVSFKLLDDDNEYIETLTKNQIAKYDFAESFNIHTSYNEKNKLIYMHLYFHPWMQKEKFKLSQKSDLEILITFFDVKDAKGIKDNDTYEWEICNTHIKDNRLCFKITTDNENLNTKADEISFDFVKATLKVVKDKYIYYYKGKYFD